MFYGSPWPFSPLGYVSDRGIQRSPSTAAVKDGGTDVPNPSRMEKEASANKVEDTLVCVWSVPGACVVSKSLTMASAVLPPSGHSSRPYSRCGLL
jgi:hypothetical protein